MISTNPRLPAIPNEQDGTAVSVGFMRKFYEHFYREWRHLAGEIINRGTFTRNTTYTTAWTATSGTAPAIGNGTLEASYTVRDGLCKVRIFLVGGSTTVWGNGGTWRFTAPFNATSTCSGSAWILDSGTAIYAPAVKIASGGSAIQVASDGAANLITFNSPMTWATSDELLIDLEYLI